jgi:imidazoleglycerol phosphate dehydratase HisB
MRKRTAEIRRETSETKIALDLDVDGRGVAEVQTGIGFLDHLFTALARHARFDLTLRCEGDLNVDDHHTAEDCAIVFGQALDKALGERRGIARFGWAYAPMDEALARASVDLSGRPFAVASIRLSGERVGELASENVEHVVASLAEASRSAIHVDVLRGSNDHHRAEAAFKALALALRQAVANDGSGEVPSTKGVL